MIQKWLWVFWRVSMFLFWLLLSLFLCRTPPLLHSLSLFGPEYLKSAMYRLFSQIRTWFLGFCSRCCPVCICVQNVLLIFCLRFQTSLALEMTSKKVAHIMKRIDRMTYCMSSGLSYLHFPPHVHQSNAGCEAIVFHSLPSINEKPQFKKTVFDLFT